MNFALRLDENQARMIDGTQCAMLTEPARARDGSRVRDREKGRLGRGGTYSRQLLAIPATAQIALPLLPATLMTSRNVRSSRQISRALPRQLPAHFARASFARTSWSSA
eukprot:5565014-Pleurochrysis_carterae.AAC.1